MHMQRRMYNRFDGYEALKPLLEGSDREVLSALGSMPALIRVPAASADPQPRARLVSCLLHGNEPSGFQAILEVLRRGERFPFDLWVLIGNVRAAIEDGLYAHRHLDDQQDFNRVWGPGPADTEMQRCAAAILAELRSADLEAALDVHNNTGNNPYYAIMPRRTPATERLASLCADTVLVWPLAMNTLMEALIDRCPAAAVECGAGHSPEGTEFASATVWRFLTAESFEAPDLPGLPQPRLMAELACRVEVRPEVTFAFADQPDGDQHGAESPPDLLLAAGLDSYNFNELPAGQPLGQVRPAVDIPLVATDMAGQDVTDQLFRITASRDLVPTQNLIPIMMTTTVKQTRRDCLFYTVRRQGPQL